MEEEKAAAYYEELTRKGEGAARFKQGLGFSSQSTPHRPSSSSSSSSSFLNQFVKSSSSNPNSTQPDLSSIKDKLKKTKKPEDHHPRVSERSHRDYRGREKDSSHRRRSRSIERRDRYGDRDRRSRRRSRSRSPRRERRKRDDVNEKKKVDYSKLINGYDDMTAAEKVKAKMKLQLDETAEKDTKMGAGWERFEFDKDAPLDDEEVEEGTNDDAALVKRMGQSFRFSAIEARREEQLQAAHDDAMFGVPTLQTPTDNTDNDVSENTNVKDSEEQSNSGTISLLSEKVLAKQQGSWRDRARKS